ncbi:AraC family transcriptional regulator [Mucilaginibacter sp. HMF5004]|uniref:AraC family transcriptional regulator n=1 Tax=Mucilaginibacter rivuli TaxID=2857527 RepID=UPI001C5E7113|nr:AraC family transcriptional regulator [Mucilaginibacter rivuli]MBW4891877.1 AraC family transcriptional regulator [Mucilaginibacter rivuli]
MKPHYLKIDLKPQNCFNVRHDILSSFRGIWHYHPELELHYVIRGEGVRFIGDNIRNFLPGELVLVGGNLPHSWRSKDEYFNNNPNLNVEVIVMHFLPDCLGAELLQLPEAYLLPKLFEKAKNGLMIEGVAKVRVIELMQKALTAENFDRIIILVSILKILAETDEYANITLSRNEYYQSNESETLRLNKVCSHTLANYRRDISLEEVASICHLSTTSFCRYFKLMMNKTYTDFLTEIRISHACRLLIENKRSTIMICYECGFNNISNFYRHFKKITKTTPFEYKQQYNPGQQMPA